VIIWHASHKRLDAISDFEILEMQSGVFFLQQLFIVRLHAFLFDRTLDIFLLCTQRKCEVGIVLLVRHKETESVEIPSLSNVVDKWSAGAGVCVLPRHGKWRSLIPRVCDLFIVFGVGKCVQVFT
jgi:hypothetical protein